MKKITKTFYQGAIIILLPLAMVALALTRFIFGVQFWRMRSSRIGHLTGNTDLFLRRLKLNNNNNNNNDDDDDDNDTGRKIKHIAISTKKVANEQIVAMFQRRIKIIKVPQPKFARALIRGLAKHPFLNKTKLFAEFPCNQQAYFEINNVSPTISFTEKEKEQGQALLKKMNVWNEKGQGWFVCFLARDPAYLDQQWKKGDSYHKFRNSDINDYLQAAAYITENDGYALRMGALVEKKLPETNQQKIIDYATNYRSDFGDIYLLGNCKFYFGNDCGPICVSYAFNKPLALTDVIPISHMPLGKNDLFIPKKIWSQKEGRVLTFKEMIDRGIYDYGKAEDYQKAGLSVINNTPQEVLDLVKEINQRLDGTWQPGKEDEELQKKFKSLFPADSPCAKIPSRIGAQFLRDNQELLN